MGIQDKRPISFHCPLGEDALLFRHMSGTEELGKPFLYKLDLYSTDVNIALQDLLGKHATVQLDATKADKRFFDGVVVDFAQVGMVGRYYHYTAELRPWFWLLTRTSNCRIFQNKSVPEIAKEIFKLHGLTDLEEALTEDYPKREYCVQYRESDFNFISRLFEEEGIYYFFSHEMGRHNMVLADGFSAHELKPGFEQVAYAKSASADDLHSVPVFNWRVRRLLQSGRYSTRDYDFLRPSLNLEVNREAPGEHELADFEVYDYPGGYTATAVGDKRARRRIEERSTRHEVAEGTTGARGLGCGNLMELVNHPRTDQNREYLLTRVGYTLDGGAFELGDSVDEIYSMTFTAMDNTLTYRPEPHTPKPQVPGPQTATVVGAGGEHHTEEYGRVQLQFPWDRADTKTAGASCWVRVSQVWAGLEWGSMHLPHVGDEVVVSFLEGDPDKPLVTGRVYNAHNVSWQKMPGAKGTSHFRDVTGNHQAMEEGKGHDLYAPNAETYLSLGEPAGRQAGIDMATDADLHVKIGGKEAVHIAKDSQTDVEGNQVLNVTRNVTVNIKGEKKEVIQGPLYHEVFGPLDVKIKAPEAKTVVGLSSDTFIGGKNSNFLGFKADLAVAGSFKREFGYENHENYSAKKKKTVGPVASISHDSYLTGAGEEYDAPSSQVLIEPFSVKVNTEETVLELKKEEARLTTAKLMLLNAQKGKVVAKAKTIVLDAPAIQATKGAFASKYIKHGK